MIAAASKLERDDISFPFHNTTLEDFETSERFDIVCLNPYGVYVPYMDEVVIKAKELLKQNDMIVSAFPDPEFRGWRGRIKSLIKCFLQNGHINYDPIIKYEKMLKRLNLEVCIKLKMKTDIGYSHCYFVKP